MSKSIDVHGAQASGGVPSKEAMVSAPAVDQATKGSLAPTLLVAPALPKDARTNSGLDLIFSKPVLAPARVEDFNSEAEISGFALGSSNDMRHKLTIASVAMAAMGNEIIDLISMIYEGSRVQLAQQAEAVQKAAKAVIDQATEAAKAGVLGKIFGWIGRIFSIIFLTLASVALSATSPALAVLTITALVLTVMDMCSAISQEVGGPDISYAGLVAMCAEACGATQASGDAIRQWLGLSLQIVTIIIGAAGGISAATKAAEMIGKVTNEILKLVSGISSIGAGASKVYIGVENYKLALAKVEEMGADLHHEQLSRMTKQWGEDLMTFMQWLDDCLRQRLNMVSQEYNSNMKIMEH